MSILPTGGIRSIGTGQPAEADTAVVRPPSLAGEVCLFRGASFQLADSSDLFRSVRDQDGCATGSSVKAARRACPALDGSAFGGWGFSPPARFAATILTLVLGLCVAGLDLAAQEAVYHVKGTVNREAFKPDGSYLIAPDNFPFEIWVNGPRWYLRCNFYDDGHYEEVGTDGIDSFGILHSATRKNDTTPRRLPATIDSGTFPASAFCDLRFLWIGLASASYLQQNHILPNPWSGPPIANDVEAKIFESDVESFSEPPFLPKKITYVLKKWNKDDQYEFAKSHSGLTLKKGFIAGEYSVESVIQYQGLTLPEVFRWERFDFTSGPKRKVFERYLGKVESVTDERLVTYIPEIQDIVSVVDRRFPDVMYVVYDVKNAKWPTINDPIVKSAQEDNAHVLPPRGEPPFNARKLSFWLVLVVAALPLLILSYLRLKKTQKKKGTV